MQRDYDIVIIGGGMVGASLACSLSNTSLRVAVIEAIPYGAITQPSYDERTITLSYGSSLIYQGLGLWSDIQKRGVSPITSIHISDQGHIGSTRYDAASVGVEALGYVVENRVLGRVLTAALEKNDHIDIISPAKLNSLEFDATGVNVAIQTPQAKSSLRARLIVAADGAQSSVRQQLNMGVQRTDYKQTAIVTTITPAQLHAQIAYERFTADGPLALLPLSENRCAVVWSVKPSDVEALLALDESAFLQRLQMNFGERLGAFHKLGKRLTFPLMLTQATETVRPRVVLIGNAAHTLHPIAGQGFNLGLRDVAVLAQVLVDALSDNKDFSAPETLRAYSQWRKQDTRTTIAFTDGLTRLFSNNFLPLMVARNLGLLAVDMLPPLKRHLLRRNMGLAGRLPRLARGLAL